jgi:hypothetical protein
MTLTNNPARAAFVTIAAEVKGHGGRMAKLVAPLVKMDVLPDDLKGGGKYHADLKDGVAQAYLTPAQYKVFADTTLATRIKGELTPRGTLQQKVSPNVDKVRKAIVAAMALPKEKRGKVEKNTPTQVFFKTIDTMVERFAKPDASDKFDFDPVVARAALVAMLKTLR